QPPHHFPAPRLAFFRYRLGTRLQIDVELAVMCPPRVVVALRPSNRLRDSASLRVLKQFGSDQLALPGSLLQRCSGQSSRMQDEVTFMQFREKLTAKEG